MEKEATLLIKGMVCNRCVMVLEEELKASGHKPVQVKLGEATVLPNGTDPENAELQKRLAPLGFSLLRDPKATITKAVKALVEEVYSGNYDFPDRFRFAALAAKRLDKDYETISDAFIAVERKTIEQYMIAFRINKVKEFLVYSSLTLADIAFRLNFTSVAHLSAQFKQHTGLTPSFFKEIQKKKTEVIRTSN